ncbi:MAG: hypothetical protein J7501_06665, partial [Bdellovibrio sp.]|nr:hypothetical protein [Bdellovibrio sp.]
MMKKLLLTFLVLTAVGCSFKKSSDKAASAAATAAAKSRVDEVMADNRYTDRQRVEASLRKGLWDIFIKALPKVSKAELNQVNKRGETLVEIALGTQRHDFLKALFDAGASPFVGASGVSYTDYRYADSESVEIITEAR